MIVNPREGQYVQFVNGKSIYRIVRAGAVNYVALGPAKELGDIGAATMTGPIGVDRLFVVPEARITELKRAEQARRQRG